MIDSATKFCSSCAKVAFVRVQFGLLCRECYRKGVILKESTLPLGSKRHTKRKRLKRYRYKKRIDYAIYMRSAKWRKKREAKLKSVSHRCQNIRCKSPLNLEAHHLTYERLGREKLSDLKILCFVCHMETHGNLPFPSKFYK